MGFSSIDAYKMPNKTVFMFTTYVSVGNVPINLYCIEI